MSDAYGMKRLREDLLEDLEAYLDSGGAPGPRPRAFRRRLSALLTPSGLACLIYRLAASAHSRGWLRIAALLSWLNLAVTRVSIAPASRIGGGLYIPHPSTGIVFQGTAGRRLSLFAGSGVAADLTPLHAGPLAQAPRLGDHVAVGSKAYIRGPVRVGDGARIGFNALVDHDVEAGARVISAHLRLRAAPGAPRTPPRA